MMTDDKKEIFARNFSALLQSQSKGVGDFYTYWAEQLKPIPRSTIHRWATVGLAKPDRNSHPHLQKIADRFGLTNINELWSEDSALFDLRRLLQNQNWQGSERGQRWRNKVLQLRERIFELVDEMERDFLEVGEKPEIDQELLEMIEAIWSRPHVEYTPSPPSKDDERRQIIQDWLNLSDAEKLSRKPPQEVLDLFEKMQEEREQRAMDKDAFKSSTLEGFIFSKSDRQK